MGTEGVERTRNTAPAKGRMTPNAGFGIWFKTGVRVRIHVTVSGKRASALRISAEAFKIDTACWTMVSMLEKR